MGSATIVVWVLLLVLVVVTLIAGVKTVPQGQVWTVERFGAYTRLLQPGLNFVLPYVDRVGRRLNVQEQVVDIPEQSVITRDNATVLVDGIIYFRVMEPEKAAYQVANLQVALNTLAMTNIRSVIGELELDATLSSRERINTTLLLTLDGATEPWGVKVSRVEIRKIEPPSNLVQAMNLQMTAERERRAVVARATGEREAAIQRAEGEKQALILSAEGRQQAAVRDAQARVQLAQAEAQATQLVSDAASRHGPAALQYFIADRYVAAFKAIAESPTSRLVVVPMEATGLAGGIAQALQILRASGGPLGEAVTPPGPPVASPPFTPAPFVAQPFAAPAPPAASVPPTSAPPFMSDFAAGAEPTAPEPAPPVPMPPWGKPSDSAG